MKLTKKEVVCIVSALSADRDRYFQYDVSQTVVDEITEKLCAEYGILSVYWTPEEVVAMENDGELMADE